MRVPSLHTEHPGSAAAHGLSAGAALIELLERNALKGSAVKMHKCSAANTQHLALAAVPSTTQQLLAVKDSITCCGQKQQANKHTEAAYDFTEVTVT